MRRFNPPDIPQPASRYSQGVEHAGRGRRLVVSGQVGAYPDGRIAPTLAEQVDLAFDNFLAVMKASGMGPEHIVKVTIYALSPEALTLSRAARDRVFAGHPPASTYLQVSALANPAFLFEVDGEAFRED